MKEDDVLTVEVKINNQPVGTIEARRSKYWTKYPPVYSCDVRWSMPDNPNETRGRLVAVSHNPSNGPMELVRRILEEIKWADDDLPA